MRHTWIVVIVSTLFGLASTAFAGELDIVDPEIATIQTETETPAEAIAPRLVKFSGALENYSGWPPGVQIVMSFSLYSSQEGGEPLWSESQLITLEADGGYTVFLGASEEDGLPLELFSTERAQWLGVQVDGEEEQPRVVLVAVPYALRAADADTVGGKPLSSFILYEDLLDEGEYEDQVAGEEAIGESSGSSIGRLGTQDRRRIITRGDLIKALKDSEDATVLTVGVPLRIVAETEIQTANLTSYGHNAGTSGFGATFVGAYAGYNNTTGMQNSFFGDGAGYLNTTGNYNSFFGDGAGYNNTTGNENSFFGEAAGYNNTTGNDNSFFGWLAGLYNDSGSNNSFFGYLAGRSNTTGNYNSFFGDGAGYNNTTGYSNAFFGRRAGYNNTTGRYNSFIGYMAGYSNTTGWPNAFFGSGAGYSNTEGNYNSFFGPDAGWYNTTGYQNSFFGHRAGYSNTEGNNNSFVGYQAGYSNTTGLQNSFFGYWAGSSNTTENLNSFIGAYSDGAVGITNATAIGYRAQVTHSNSLVLGSINGVNGADADVNVGIGTTAPQYRLHVVGDVHVAGRFTFNSDARLKKDVNNLDYGLQEVIQLRPVSWHWKEPSDQQLSFGLIAQEVEPVLPQLVNHPADEDGILGLDYVSLVPVLIRAIQEQQDALNQKDAEIEALNARLTALERMMEQLASPQLTELSR